MPQEENSKPVQEVSGQERLEQRETTEQEAAGEVSLIDEITNLERAVADDTENNRKSLEDLKVEASGDSEIAIDIDTLLTENSALEEETRKALAKEVPISRDSLLDFLQSGELDKVWIIFEQLNLSADELASPDIQQAAQDCLVMVLEDSAAYKGESFNVSSLMDRFRMSADVANVPEVRQAASACLARSLEMKWALFSFVNFDDLVDKFKFSKEELKEAFFKSFKKALLETYSDLYLRNLDEIMQKLELSEDVLKSAEIQKSGEKYFANMLASQRKDKALYIKDKLHLPDDVVRKIGKLELYNTLARGNYHNFSYDIIKLCDLSQEEVQDAVKDAIPGLFAEGNFRDAQLILKGYPLGDEVMSSLFMQQSIKSGLINTLRKDYALVGVLPDLEGLPISDEIINEPEVQSLVTEAYTKETNLMNQVRMKKIFHLAT